MLAEGYVIYLGVSSFKSPAIGAALSIGVFLSAGGFGSILSNYIGKKGLAIFVISVLLYFISKSPLISAAFAGIASCWLFPFALRIFSSEKISRLLFWDVMGCLSSPFLFWLIFTLLNINFVLISTCILLLAIILYFTFRV